MSGVWCVFHAASTAPKPFIPPDAAGDGLLGVAVVAAGGALLAFDPGVGGDVGEVPAVPQP